MIRYLIVFLIMLLPIEALAISAEDVMKNRRLPFCIRARTLKQG